MQVFKISRDEDRGEGKEVQSIEKFPALVITVVGIARTEKEVAHEFPSPSYSTVKS